CGRGDPPRVARPTPYQVAMRPHRVAALVAVVIPPALGAQRKAAPAPTPPPPPPPPPPAVRGTIAPGDTVRDSLTRRDVLLRTENTYALEWRLAGRAGTTV